MVRRTSGNFAHHIKSKNLNLSNHIIREVAIAEEFNSKSKRRSPWEQSIVIALHVRLYMVGTSLSIPLTFHSLNP
jgi:hypothetical protein